MGMAFAYRMRPEDQILLLAETPASPMHIGALQYYDRRGLTGDPVDVIRAHFEERIARFPVLSSRLVRPPLGFDGDYWKSGASIDPAYHFVRERAAQPHTDRDIRARLVELVMERLDLDHPPFRVHVFDTLADPDRIAIYFKIHHCAVDGVAFQNVMRIMFGGEQPPDPDSPEAGYPRRLGALPWLQSLGWFWRHRGEIAAWRAAAAAATAELAEMEARSPSLPEAKLKMGRSPSLNRELATISLSLDRVRAIGRRIGGSVNDVYMGLCATAIRQRLIELDDLPEEPLVAIMPRSYRRPEHGPWGNRIVMLFPSLATHLPDPLDRIAAFRAAVADDLPRGRAREVQIDEPWSPFGSRRRRKLFGAMEQGYVLPGNVVISNVPGPAEPYYLGGMHQLSNFPVPQLASGTFLNITSRRREDALDIAISTDTDKCPGAEHMADLLAAALDELEQRTAALG